MTGMLEFGVVHKPALTLVGLPVRGDWNSLWQEMPKVWAQWFERINEVKGRAQPASIDASLAHKDGMYFQLVCALVNDTHDVPSDMLCLDIPEKRYLHAEHKGPVGDIAESFGAMYKWAVQNGLNAGDFKLDVGYTPSGKEPSHQLFIELLD